MADKKTPKPMKAPASKVSVSKTTTKDLKPKAGKTSAVKGGFRIG